MFSREINDFKNLIEDGLFGVLKPLGEVLGIESQKIRLFFIYISFLTLGSPIFIYMTTYFVLNINKYIKRKKRNPIWDF
jgi:phage shock protein PspC (stress-responsive transcriptional regulator)